jgi:hypothetical protein
MPLAGLDDGDGQGDNADVLTASSAADGLDVVPRPGLPESLGLGDGEGDGDGDGLGDGLGDVEGLGLG